MRAGILLAMGLWVLGLVAARGVLGADEMPTCWGLTVTAQGEEHVIKRFGARGICTRARVSLIATTCEDGTFAGREAGCYEVAPYLTACRPVGCEGVE